MEVADVFGKVADVSGRFLTFQGGFRDVSDLLTFQACSRRFKKVSGVPFGEVADISLKLLTFGEVSDISGRSHTFWLPLS